LRWHKELVLSKLYNPIISERVDLNLISVKAMNEIRSQNEEISYMRRRKKELRYSDGYTFHFAASLYRKLRRSY